MWNVYNLNWSPYTESLWASHDKQFKKEQTPEGFNEKMERLRSQVDPRFLEQFDDYANKVSSLLSENVTVANNPIVQEVVATQNNRVLKTMSKNAETLNRKYMEVMLWKAANDDDFTPLDLDKAA